MIKLVEMILFTALALASTRACAAGTANPLLGTWTPEPNGYVDSQGFEYCKLPSRMVFTPLTQILFNENGDQGTTKVSYLVYPSGKSVAVSATQSFFNASKYDILGPNEIQATSAGGCKYSRG